jgi:hypothetical protein
MTIALENLSLDESFRTKIQAPANDPETERRKSVAHEQEVMKVMETLRIADKHTVGQIMSVRVGWKTKVSAPNQAYKALGGLADLGKIEKHQGYFRLPGCRSEYGEHARLVTQAIAVLLIKYPDSIIHREHTIPEVGLRPDALVLIKNQNMGICIVLEVLVNETEEYYRSKENTWRSWEGATEYLSKLFGYRIPHFLIIPVKGGEDVCEKLPLFA